MKMSIMIIIRPKHTGCCLFVLQDLQSILSWTEGCIMHSWELVDQRCRQNLFWAKDCLDKMRLSHHWTFQVALHSVWGFFKCWHSSPSKAFIQLFLLSRHGMCIPEQSTVTCLEWLFGVQQWPSHSCTPVLPYAMGDNETAAEKAGDEWCFPTVTMPAPIGWQMFAIAFEKASRKATCIHFGQIFSYSSTANGDVGRGVKFSLPELNLVKINDILLPIWDISICCGKDNTSLKLRNAIGALWGTTSCSGKQKENCPDRTGCFIFWEINIFWKETNIW